MTLKSSRLAKLCVASATKSDLSTFRVYFAGGGNLRVRLMTFPEMWKAFRLGFVGNTICRAGLLSPPLGLPISSFRHHPHLAMNVTTTSALWKKGLTLTSFEQCIMIWNSTLWEFVEWSSYSNWAWSLTYRLHLLYSRGTSLVHISSINRFVQSFRHLMNEWMGVLYVVLSCAWLRYETAITSTQTLVKTWDAVDGGSLEWSFFKLTVLRPLLNTFKIHQSNLHLYVNQQTSFLLPIDRSSG